MKIIRQADIDNVTLRLPQQGSDIVKAPWNAVFLRKTACFDCIAGVYRHHLGIGHKAVVAFHVDSGNKAGAKQGDSRFVHGDPPDLIFSPAAGILCPILDDGNRILHCTGPPAQCRLSEI